MIYGRMHDLHTATIQRFLGKFSGVTGKLKKIVSLSQRNSERFGQFTEKFPARFGLTRFHEAKVSRRAVDFQGQIHLADSLSLSPVANHGSGRIEVGRLLRCFSDNITSQVMDQIFNPS
tara:strand:- start:114306 stop:114662 length:357 start_codon:yes stop_codon:yes gene_type:complete